MDMIEQQILVLLKDKDEDITINDIAEHMKIDRHTAAKRLEMLKSKGLVEYRIVGKSKMWKVSKSPFLNALKSNDEISNTIKNILKHVEGEVHIKDKKSVIWSNNKHHTSDACCSGNKKCKDCSVDKTFKTGNSETSTKSWLKRKVQIVTQPIKDDNNNTIAVIEIIKDKEIKDKEGIKTRDKNKV
jgi:predicted transcriptional regulator